MPKFEHNTHQIFSRIDISAANLINLGFRLALILIGLTLIFVAAIYYGIINP
jgi:hypothetical protein